jgi:hypothetical protein
MCFSQGLIPESFKVFKQSIKSTRIQQTLDNYHLFIFIIISGINTCEKGICVLGRHA